MLKFSPANAKTKRLASIPALAQYLDKKKKVYSLDLLSGWSCPGSLSCRSCVKTCNGKRTIQDGPHTQYRCFSASQEAVYTNVYNLRKHNFNLIKRSKNIVKLLCNSIPKNAGVIRFHVGGDFFNKHYFRAAIECAALNPHILFYGYTKSLHILSELCESCDNLRKGVIRPNFLITASYGGRFDHLIPDLNIRSAKVIFSENEAGELPIDHDDSHAAIIGGNFALLLHGPQPKGKASKALRELNGVGSYSRKVAV